ncbi:MAG: exonuclease SbcCD subunit D [candidate division KSB1 bacterium]|nr:exonuclease SbcCD subunit D [candidate division KSB1 bacterium]
MKLVHISDTHLGFSEYHKVDSESGLNQREQDFYRSWQTAIEQILSLKPDVVVHAGDLFHTPRPSNRAIHTAMQSIQQLNDAEIPVILTAGNHETPRIRLTGSIFEPLNLFPHVYAAYSSRYERFRLGDTDFHCLPHCSLSEDLKQAIQDIEIRPQAAANILIAHGAWAGKRRYGMGEFNEQIIPDIETLRGLQFDYTALGHYHRHLRVKDHTFYCGSTERTSLNEHQAECGFLAVDIDKATYDFQPLPTRSMRKFSPLDCSGLTSTRIYQELETLAESDIKDAIVQINLTQIEHDAFVKLDMRQIDELFKSAFVLEKQMSKKQQNGTSAGETRIESLPVEFERYLQQHTSGEFNADRLCRLGGEYLDAVEQATENPEQP